MSNINTMPQQEFVTAKTLSTIISVPTFTILKKVRDGIFPAYQVGKKGYLFKPQEIIEIINERKVN
jgi:hypothetical protein